MAKNPQVTRASQRQKRSSAALKANLKRRKAMIAEDEAEVLPADPDLAKDKEG